MQVRELSVPGAYEITPVQFGDDRGTFLEWFKGSVLAETLGRELSVAQANCSVSQKGVLRGIHFADVPPGQAKYVTCLRGAVLDVAVDVRLGSPTFGRWDASLLDTSDRRVLYLSEGLGHAFIALEDDSTVVYLCSSGYAPAREHEVDALDPGIGISWPEELTPVRSRKDAEAPTLAEAAERGILPGWAEARTYLAPRSQ